MRYRDRRSQLANLLFDALGMVFVLLAAFSLYVVVFLIVTFGDQDVAFPFGAAPTRQQTVGALKVTGLILFGLLSIIAAGAANVLLDHPISRFRRWRRREDEESLAG